MHLTHTDNQQRVDLWRGGRVTDIEIFLAAKPYLNRRLAVHYGSGQCVRVFDEPELSMVSRMLAAYYNFESDHTEDPLSDPFYKSSLWNTCVFAQEPDGSIMPMDGSKKKYREKKDDPRAERENATDLVRGKLHDIMLPAAPLKTTQLREKLMDLNTDTSKVCLQYLDSCQNVRMIDLMTICHILNKEQLYILEDEDSIVEDDFLRSLESIVSINE